MKVNPEQLPDQLAKRLDAGYLVTGDEPLLVQEACDRIRERAVAEGYEERTVFQTDAQFDWQQVHDETQALSLFASRRRIEVRLHSGKPGKGREVLEAFAKAPPEDVILIVSGPRLDSGETSKAWFRNWQKVGLHVPVWPVDPADFPRWLSRRADAMGLKLTRNAVSQLSERLEGNLLAAHQELERLRVIAGDDPVDDAVAIGGVEDSSRYNAFELSAEALAGNRVHALQMLRRLEERPGVDTERLQITPDEELEGQSLDQSSANVHRSSSIDEELSALQGLKGGEQRTDSGSGVDDQAAALKELREQQRNEEQAKTPGLWKRLKSYLGL